MKKTCLCVGACLLLAGCLPEKKIIWAPNGQQAVVLAQGDFHLCDAQGKLSPTLLPNVVAAAWFPDSERLVLARSVEIANWKELAAALEPEQVKLVTDLGNAILPRLKAGAKLEELVNKDAQKQGDFTIAAGLLYLRDNQPQAFQTWANEHADESKTADNVNLIMLQLARISRQKTVEPGSVLAKSLAGPAEIRIAPDGKTIAWVNRTNALWAVSADGLQPVQLVEPRAILFPDWSPDSRSLVFIKPVGEAEIQLGLLARKTILDESGKMTVTHATEDLAGMLYDDTSKVRCLRDGRILFSGVDLRIPLTAKEMPQREQLFALDLARQATVVRLIPREVEEEIPQKCWSFEVSPDEKRLSIAADDGRIVVFTVAAGSVETVQTSRGDKAFKFVPTWRSADELCFAALPDKTQTNQVQKPGVALWSAGKIRVLSQDWPTNVLSSLMD